MFRCVVCSYINVFYPVYNTPCLIQSIFSSCRPLSPLSPLVSPCLPLPLSLSVRVSLPSKAMDADDSRDISWDEFMNYVTTRCMAGVQEREFKEAFAMFDKDGDGTIDKEEVRGGRNMNGFTKQCWCESWLHK